MGPTLIVVSSVLVLLAVIVALRQYTRHLRARGRAELDRRYPASELLLTETLALSFGQQSKGVTQLRGSGALALTSTELCFVMYVPTSELRIPLAAVKAVSLVMSHLGKTQGTNLLHVRFTRDGVEDAIAWRLPDPGSWKAQIEPLLLDLR